MLRPAHVPIWCIRKQRFSAGPAWGAITRGELCAGAEDDRGGSGENGTGGQRSSVPKCKVQREATPRRTINRIQKIKIKKMNHRKWNMPESHTAQPLDYLLSSAKLHPSGWSGARHARCYQTAISSTVPFHSIRQSRITGTLGPPTFP